jgi:hypothetical protein
MSSSRGLPQSRGQDTVTRYVPPVARFRLGGREYHDSETLAMQVLLQIARF